MGTAVVKHQVFVENSVPVIKKHQEMSNILKKTETVQIWSEEFFFRHSTLRPAQEVLFKDWEGGKQVDH